MMIMIHEFYQKISSSFSAMKLFSSMSNFGLVMIKTETKKETEGVMDALKFRMVTGMLAFTMAGLASENKTSTYLKDRMYLTFENAMQYCDLVLALYQQTELDFQCSHQSTYLAAVVVEDVQYIIMGNYEEWKLFYDMKWEFLLKDCPQVMSPN